MFTESEGFLVYPWEVSATGDYDRDQLRIIQDADMGSLVKVLGERGGRFMTTVIAEIFFHGQPRRAAELARTLCQQNSGHDQTLRTGLENFATYLLDNPIENVPSNPGEYAAKPDYIS